MTATLLGNNRATRDAFVPPPTLNDDGTPVKWRMFYENGERIADANQLGDLIEIFIDDYSLLSTEEERKSMRAEYLRDVQRSTRANVLASIPREKFESLTDTERYALTHEESMGPDFSMDNDGSPFVWSQSEPLVLIEEEFSPYTDLTPPISSEGAENDVSNIIWLQNGSELEFLLSLNKVGIIVFGEPRAVNRTPKDIRNS